MIKCQTMLEEECQTVTELFLIHQYYSVYVKQCQITMLEECQTVTEQFI